MSGGPAAGPTAGFGASPSPRANRRRRWRWAVLVAVVIVAALVVVDLSGLSPTRTGTGRLSNVRIVPSYSLPVIVLTNLSIVFCNGTGVLLVETGTNWACVFTIADQDWTICVESITEAGASMVSLVPATPLTIPAGPGETFTLTILTPTTVGVTVDLNVSIVPVAGAC